MTLRPGAPHVSTFHSFCVSVLRRHIEHLGYRRDFTIYDDDDQLRVMRACIQELGLSEQMTSPRSALAKISYTKNRGTTPEELSSEAANPEMERLAALFELYQSKLRRANALDFDDLLLKTVELFYKSSEVCEKYNERFPYVHVDEYQDTNHIQYESDPPIDLASPESLRGGRRGPIDLSLARGRHREYSQLQKDYPNAKVIRLEQNYRSTQLILDAAGAVVSLNLARKGKTLWTDRSRGDAAPAPGENRSGKNRARTPRPNPEQPGQPGHLVHQFHFVTGRFSSGGQKIKPVVVPPFDDLTDAVHRRPGLLRTRGHL